MKAMTLDYSTLNWVKAEIDESLKQAREALEAFAGNPADLAQMRFCANHLHQVRGTLQMIELYGASLLAEEVEQLAFALLNEEAKRDNNTYEVLMRGILQLPGYLERVQTGHADNPIILLPVLNDLRAARGQNLLSESALFNPDLSVLRPRAVGFEANLNESLVTEADIRSVARKLRPVYQQAFVNWHRNTRDVKHVKQLLQTVNRLEDVSHTDALGQLWWVAGGVLEALIEEGLQANVSIELLMGKVDRQIKRLIEVGELEWAAEPAKELIKNLLYYVAQARPQGARVVTLKQAFRLDEILPSQESIAQATETLAGPSLELMATVSAVIKEDLARVKDGLDIFVRSEQASPLDLEPLLGILRRTADTLGMLGLGVQRRTVLDQSAIIQTITQGQTLPSEGELMNVASALLEVESSLDRLGREKQEQQAQEPASEHLLSEDSFPDGKAQPRLSETEYRQLLAAVIKEAKADMSRIKDAIMNFIVQPMAHSLLTSVPQLMTQIMGCLSLLGQNRAATLLESCKKHIVDKLIERKSIPDQAQLDTLADIISSIEYYLEALDENRSERESFLDFAEDRLAHFTLDAPTVEGETENVLPESMWQPAHQDTTSSLEYSFGEPAQATASLSPANIIRVDDVDQEIIDIFLEEAQEELSSIATHLPEWRHDPENRHVLTTVRRSFHTLKGSGRMVGAAAIGEFAWAFEKMLNKVIDGTLEVSPAVFGLVEEAHRALPQLIKSFKENIAPATVVEELMERARRLTEAGDTSALKFPGVLPLPVPDVENIFPDSYSEPASDESMELMLREDVPVMGETDMNTALEIAAAPLPLETEYTEIVLPREVEHVPQPRLDPVLLGIFDREIKGHLEAIEKFIETCVLNSQHCRMTEAMTRTLHTVHGSAAMAGVSEITRPSALLEKYAKRLSLQQTIVGPETIAVLRDSTAFIRETLAALHDADMPMLDASELMGTISSLDKAVPDESDPHSLEKKDFSEQDNNLAVPDTDNEIVEIFLEEAREILDASEIVLQQWVTDQSNNKLLEELQRELHTLKGGARMAGIAAIGDLSHSLESMVTAVIDGDLVLSPHLPKLMHQTQDRLVEMLESISTNVPVASAHDLIALIEKMISVGPQEEQQQDNVVALVQPPTKPRKENLMLPDDQVSFEEPVPIPIADLPEPIQEDADDRRQVLRPQSEQVRVRAELLDSLVNYAAEISISRSRIEQQVGAFKFNLEEMDEIVDRLRGQLRKLDIETEAQILFRYAETASRENEEFDPLEFDRFSLMQQLSRSLLESVNDLESVEALLKNWSVQAPAL